VLIVVTALRLLGLGESGVGTLTAAVGLGGVVGGAVVFARMRSGHHGVDLGLGLLFWGVPLVVLALFSSQPAALILLGFVGVGVTMVDVAALTLLQRSAAGDLLPHAMGVLQTIFVVTVGAGTLIAPTLVAGLGIRGALLATGALLPLLSMTLWQRLRKLDETAPHLQADVTLLAGIPIFAPLGEGALVHLASALEPVEFEAGEVVFYQGDSGDCFYVVKEGELEIVTDGRVVFKPTAGGYFGEIALLRNVPRTATIRALTDVKLLRLEGETFVAAVTGNSASSDAAQTVIGDRLGLRPGLVSL